jgi:tetratricopeptide (TPR) repeat protein
MQAAPLSPPAPAAAPFPRSEGSFGAGIEAAGTLDLLAALVDKSLVVYEEREDGRARYRLTETVRQYARDRLRESGAAASMRERHCHFFLALAEDAEPKLRGAEQSLWLGHIETEHDNLRAGLEWSRESEADGSESGSAALRLSGALWWFWMIRGYVAEGRAHLENALARAIPEAAEEAAPERAKALMGAGALAYQQGDYGAARAFWNQSLAVQRAREDKRGIAAVLSNLGIVAREQGEYAQARSFYEESLALRREIGDRQGVAGSLNNLALLLSDQGEADAARTRYEEALGVMRELGDQYGLGTALNNLGKLAHEQGDAERARALVQEALTVRRQTGDRRGIAMSLVSLGSISQDLGDPDAARALNAEALAISRDLGDRWLAAYALDGLAALAAEREDFAAAGAWYRESLALRREIGDKLGVAHSLHVLARLRAIEGSPEVAVRLWAASSSLCGAIGAPLPLSPAARTEHEQRLAAARSALGEEAFARAWAAGQALSPEEAAADAAFARAETSD